jgi:RHS repeat-associated protein
VHRNHLSQVVDPINYGAGYGIDSTYGRPFGSGGDDQFAGHKDDPESGLHYNLARSYDPIMSRWPSPDKVTNTYDPQSLNKYAYNRNDPVNLVDPDGRYTVGDISWLYGDNAYYYMYYMVSWGYFMNDYILWSQGTFYQPTSYPQSGVGGGGGGYQPSVTPIANSEIDTLLDVLNNHKDSGLCQSYFADLGILRFSCGRINYLHSI